MKHATIKTLGVTALGAALAAVGSGAANAAVTDGVQRTASDVVRTLPLDDTAENLPGGSGEILKAGTDLVAGADKLPLADDTLSHTTQGLSSSDALGEATSGLLGGLPVTDLVGG
ncbi:ATP-binding protein [Streptomyces sp. 4N509B]|uniref:ATP-binding protein n=1 Tax=Streptomyces sp. 4N509B TaxID=3457413 RepID=UPI003FD50B97